jgi:hypothetical protein
MRPLCVVEEAQIQPGTIAAEPMRGAAGRIRFVESVGIAGRAIHSGSPVEPS